MSLLTWAFLTVVLSGVAYGLARLHKAWQAKRRRRVLLAALEVVAKDLSQLPINKVKD